MKEGIEMKFLDTIKENSILVIPNNLKDQVLRDLSRNKKLLNIKLITIDELLDKLTFIYDERSILYLVKKYKYKPSIAKTIIDNLKYLTRDSYSNKRLNDLLMIKNELKDNNLITEDLLYKNFLRDKEIYFYGFSHVDKFIVALTKDYNCTIVEEEISPKDLSVHEFKTLEEELDYVYCKIISLIKSGVAPSNIKIANFQSDYINTSKRLTNYYGLEILLPKEDVYSSSIVQDFLKTLKETKSFNETLESISNNYDLGDEVTNKIYNQLLDVANKLNYLEDYSEEALAVLDYLLKNIKIKEEKTNMIETVDLCDNVFSRNDHVFVISFNQNILPKLYKDEDFFSDTEKEELDIETTDEKNSLSKRDTVNSLYKIDNLYLSYKLHHLNNDYYPSNLISELNITKEEEEFRVNYSKLHDEIKLTAMLDDFIKFGIMDKDLPKYYSNYDIDYLSYDNSYTPIPGSKIKDKLKEQLLLSYSSLNNFNKCHFRYYISNILRIDQYEETFKTMVGNLFHYVLSCSFTDDFDFDKEWTSFLKEKELKPSEEFFLKKLKDELRDIITFIKEMDHETALTEKLLEHKIYIDKTKDFPTSFMGIIDKVMYQDKEDEQLIAIVDYKTGNMDIKLNNLIYGIDMQLPIYWYLLLKSHTFKNPKFTGIYLENILKNIPKRDSKKTLAEVKRENLKLVGYSSIDQLRVAKFDPTYESSLYIKGMKTKKDGEYGTYTKVLTDEELEEIVSLIDQKIEQARDEILDGDFKINPLRLDNEDTGCKFCHFQDICYRKEQDFRKERSYRDLSFLGGDDNA